MPFFHPLSSDHIPPTSQFLPVIPALKMKVLVAQLWPTLGDCSLPGSSVHGIFQARILEWVAMHFSSGSSWTWFWTGTEPGSPALQADSLLSEPPGASLKAPICNWQLTVMMPLAKPRKQHPGLQIPYFHVSAVLGPAVVDLAVFLQQAVYNLNPHIHYILTHPSGANSRSSGFYIY